MAFKCDIPAVPTSLQDDDVVRITRWDFAPGAVDRLASARMAVFRRAPDRIAHACP